MQQPGLRSPQIVRVGIEHDEDERNYQVEEEPSIDHLNVGCLWQTLIYLDNDHHDKDGGTESS